MKYPATCQHAYQLSFALLMGLFLMACTPTIGSEIDPTRPAATKAVEPTATAIQEANAPTATQMVPTATTPTAAALVASSPTPMPGQPVLATPTPAPVPVQTAPPDLPFVETVQFTLQDQYGGQATAITVEGQTTFLALGSRLYLLDLSQPPAIQVLGRSQPLAAPILDIAVRDGLAYLALGAKGLEILDISQPAQISRINQGLSQPTGGALATTAVDLVADMIYVWQRNQFDGALTLHRFQLDSAAAMNWIDQIQFSNDSAPVVAGDLLLIQDSGRWALRSLAEPEQALGFLALPADTFSVQAVVDGKVLNTVVAGPSSGLVQFDISDPSNPLPLGELLPMDVVFGHQLVSNGRLLVLASTFGEFGYCGTQLGLVQLVGDQPQAEAPWDPQNCVRGMALWEDDLLLAGQSGLDWYHVADPADPQLLATYSHPAGFYAADDIAIVQDLAKAQDVLYVLTSEGRGHSLVALARSVDGLAVLSERLSLGPGSPTQLLLAGEELLVPTWQGGLNVIDIGQPAAPRLLHPAEDGEAYMSSPLGVADGGQVVYQEMLHDSGARLLTAVDLSDPADPVIAGQFAGFSGQLTDLLAVGQFLYVLDQLDRSQLHIYDISQPRLPQRLAQLQLPEAALRLALVGSDLFAACGWGCDSLFHIDVSDPAAPRLAGSWRMPLDVWQMASDEQGWVYLVDGTSNLWLLDAADPADLHWAGHWPYTGGAFKVVGDEIWMADWNSGLYRIRIDR